MMMSMQEISDQRVKAELERVALMSLMLPKHQKPPAYAMLRTLRLAMTKPIDNTRTAWGALKEDA